MTGSPLPGPPAPVSHSAVVAAGTRHPPAAGGRGDLPADLRQVLAQSGLYAAAALAQQGVSFLLLPLYTRFVPQAEYGQLELLNAFSSIAFACLMLGLPSAITKCYHRDCGDDAQRAAVLPTALLLDSPLLLLGGALLMAAAGPLAAGLLGSPGGAGLVRLMTAGGVLSSLVALVLASLRAEERAAAFGVLSLAQFTSAMVLNVLLVVHWHLGVRGILWGNLLSYALALAVAVALAGRGRSAASGAAAPGPGVHFDRRLASPLLRFGVLLLPVLLASWVMDLSDRYVLRLYSSLSEVAVYAVGYKLGMVLQVAIVWPFQLAWPAISFRISHREGHRETYSQTVTWLAAAMAAAIAGLTLLSRVAVPALVGSAYREAYRVVPLVALAYAWNGLHYALSPGIHLAGRTRHFPLLALAAAALNLGLNFMLIPRFGGMGAAWATALAFALFALGTAWLGQRFYPVPYEYGKLARIAASLALVLWLGTLVPPDRTAFSLGWHVSLALLGVPALLLATGVLLRRPVRPWRAAAMRGRAARDGGS